MSVNLNISFEIHNINEIHDQEDKRLRNEIYAAAKAFIKEEGLSQDVFVDFLGLDGYLAAYTMHPVIISRSYVWVPDVTQRWEEMSYRILGPSCQPKVNVEYPDEEE